MGQRLILIISSISGLLAVGLGAFGAHALKGILTANGRMETYELATRYHFYHTIALLVVGLLADKYPGVGTGAIFFLAGIIIFSGSLYTLSLTNQTWWGAITPIGGVMLLAGWGNLLWTFFKSSK
ncbi:MAG: DUF423 domain-containing protein [Cyclobacteriaceae bacterium]|nr:DUF423 domain-containing protein [Cyclobacteriaceae bacterium]